MNVYLSTEAMSKDTLDFHILGVITAGPNVEPLQLYYNLGLKFDDKSSRCIGGVRKELDRISDCLASTVGIHHAGVPSIVRHNCCRKG
jgi:hypothetical protein